MSLGSYESGNFVGRPGADRGPGGGQEAGGHAAAIGDWLKAGGSLLAIGLDEAEANAFLPLKVRMKKAEHIAAFFEPVGKDSLLAGIGPADVHNRDPRELPLVSGGATVVGDGVLAKSRRRQCGLLSAGSLAIRLSKTKYEADLSTYLIPCFTASGQHGGEWFHAASPTFP